MNLEKFFEKIGLEWTYIVGSPQYPWRFKVGRSTSFSVRARDIARTMSREAGIDVRVVPFFKLPMFWAGRSERAIHAWPMFRYFKANMPGSGCTEWAWVLNPYVGILAYSICSYHGIHCALWVGGVIFFAPLALDFAFILIVIAMLQYGVVGVILYCLWNTFC